jgi:hypothetical protein
MCAEASTIVRAVAAGFFCDCWDVQIPSDECIRDIPRGGHYHAQGLWLEVPKYEIRSMHLPIRTVPELLERSASIEVKFNGCDTNPRTQSHCLTSCVTMLQCLDPWFPTGSVPPTGGRWRDLRGLFWSKANLGGVEDQPPPPWAILARMRWKVWLILKIIERMFQQIVLNVL